MITPSRVRRAPSRTCCAIWWTIERSDSRASATSFYFTTTIMGSMLQLHLISFTIGVYFGHLLASSSFANWLPYKGPSESGPGHTAGSFVCFKNNWNYEHLEKKIANKWWLSASLTVPCPGLLMRDWLYSCNSLSLLLFLYVSTAAYPRHCVNCVSSICQLEALTSAPRNLETEKFLEIKSECRGSLLHRNACFHPLQICRKKRMPSLVCKPLHRKATSKSCLHKDPWPCGRQAVRDSLPRCSGTLHSLKLGPV